MAVSLTNYKLSDINIDFVKHFLRVDWDEDDIELNLYLESAKAYVSNYTQITLEELDEIQFSTICVLKLTSDFYNNKLATNNGKNYVPDSTMEMLLTQIRTYQIGAMNGVQNGI